MPAERTSMRIIKEVLRLKFEADLSQRQISRSLKIGLGTVSLHLNRAKAAGLINWPLPENMSDLQLEQALFPNRLLEIQPGYVEPNYALIHDELKRKGVTKQLLWEEYKHIHGKNGYQYSQYCQRYRDWVGTLRLSMRQIHKAGEKLFIDYCGPTIPIVNPATGEICGAQVFVATWGASNYTYAEATRTQTKADWIQSHVNAFEFFGGVPELIIPDQLRSAVSKPCRYDPVINATYQHMANHYNTAIMPARPRKPKDKSKVENAVLVVERWIMARLRHITFFTLAELNQQIRVLLADLNQRPFKKLPGCRASQFELLDKPVIRSLPSTTYQLTEFKKVRVNIDYHIEYDKHFYSVPYHLVKLELEVQATRDGVAIFFKGNQVARHARSARQGGYTTLPEHMPKAHRKHSEWSPGRLLNWAQEVGPHTLLVTQDMLNRKKHPEQAYRGCLGLLNLARKYNPERLEKACERAMAIGSPYNRSIKSILQKGLDQLPTSLPLELDENPQPEPFSDCHDNIRGPDYYA